MAGSDAVAQLRKELYSRADLRGCLHDSCRQSTRRCHVFSEAACLRPIAKQGKLYSFHKFESYIPRPYFLGDKPAEIGLTAASTYPLFCGPHDQALFKLLDEGTVVDGAYVDRLYYRQLSYLLWLTLRNCEDAIENPDDLIARRTAMEMLASQSPLPHGSPLLGHEQLRSQLQVLRTAHDAIGKLIDGDHAATSFACFALAGQSPFVGFRSWTISTGPRSCLPPYTLTFTNINDQGYVIAAAPAEVREAITALVKHRLRPNVQRLATEVLREPLDTYMSIDWWHQLRRTHMDAIMHNVMCATSPIFPPGAMDSYLADLPLPPIRSQTVEMR